MKQTPPHYISKSIKRQRFLHQDASRNRRRLMRRRIENTSILPQFWDTDHTLSASKFSARRLPEVKSLWRTFMDSSFSQRSSQTNEFTNDNYNDDAWYYISGGGKASKRHLRRRAGSHNRRVRHRFPNGGIDADAESPQEAGKGEDAVKRTKIYDEKNAIEVISSPQTNDEQNINMVQDIEPYYKSRKARRKPGLLREIRSSWKNDGNVLSPSSSNWLDTHLWHAKRFHMSPPLSCFQNWCVPLGHTNRGARAALRLARTKSTVQDATWAIGGQAITVSARTNKTLVAFVQRVCGGDGRALFLRSSTVRMGLRVGEGVIYKLNATFPAGAIGPASFIFGRHGEQVKELESINMAATKSCFVRILVNSSILDDVRVLCQDLLRERQSELNCTTVRERMTLIRVRGLEATKVINRSFKLSSPISLSNIKDPEYWNWRIISQCNEAHYTLPHGIIIPVVFKGALKHHQYCSKSIDEDEPGKKDKNDGICIQDDDRSLKYLQPKAKFDSLFYKANIILISQCPNPVNDSKSLEQNIGICGWDILCVPEEASRIFSSLCNQGGSCAIALVEELCLQLEANPPRPVFPRDYPDTDIGHSYWSDENSEWELIRYCVEEGLSGGRITTGLKRLMEICASNDFQLHAKRLNTHPIKWSVLMNAPSLRAVVVRGSFIEPFKQAISDWNPKQIMTYVDYPKGKTKRKNRRPRRKVHGFYKSIEIPPLPNDYSEAHQRNCKLLYLSLSLPALLPCQLIMEGKGTFQAGMFIIEWRKKITEEIVSQSLLGYVVSGAFSPSRGKHHGIGFVSSKRLLNHLAKVEYGRCVVARSMCRDMQVAIRVLIHSTSQAIPVLSSLKLLKWE